MSAYVKGNAAMPYNVAVGVIKSTESMEVLDNNTLVVVAWFDTREEANDYARAMKLPKGRFGKVSGPGIDQV